MSLPIAWVDRIFEKLSLVYGREFLSRWDGLPIEDVKTDWSYELSGFRQFPEAIRYALENLPRDRPPTVLMFREACRRAPSKPALALPAPAPDIPRVKLELSRLMEVRAQFAAEPADPNSGTDHKAWARRIIARHAAGERIPAINLRFAREALRAHLATEEPA